MTLKDYKHIGLPALYQHNYNDVYNSFVKAMYCDGYKIKYVDNLDSKYFFDEENNVIHLKNGLSNRIKIHCLLEVYSNNITDNDFDKELLKHTISTGVGIDDNFNDRYNMLDWYKNNDINNVIHTFKLISTKGRKFIDNFNRFFDIEKKSYTYEKTSLYDDYSMSF